MEGKQGRSQGGGLKIIFRIHILQALRRKCVNFLIHKNFGLDVKNYICKKQIFQEKNFFFKTQTEYKKNLNLNSYFANRITNFQGIIYPVTLVL